jgi:uncharacterized protein YdhG (YjbR/CyaY superfamily)
MASSDATTVEEYLDELPPERRAVVAEVRDVVRGNLPDGFEEGMNWGMISYEIPLETYPDTYNGKPLSYIALAAQKHYYALYLHNVYQQPQLMAELVEGFQNADKKMDMGKSCLRFRKLEDLPLDVVAKIVAASSVEDMIAGYEKHHPRTDK